MYKIKGRVRYSECDEKKRAKLSAIIDYFQDCSSEQSEEIGAGIAYLKAKKRAWFLNSWQVIVERYPEMAEEIEVSTWAYAFKGAFGYRNYCMKTMDGEVLAYANSLWIYMDTERGRPVKATEEEIAMYPLEPPLEMEPMERKINVPEGANVVDTFSVRKYHIDTNHHMNNGKYIQAACEVLPEGYQVEKMRVAYKKAAVYGDEIVVKKAIEEKENRIIVSLEPYVVVEFIGE